MEDIAKEVKLIDLIRDNPSVWNKKSSHYKNKVFKEKIWESIGSELGYSVPECIRFWTNLRSQFFAHQRKLRKPSGSANGTRPFFRHEKSMQFLCDTNDLESTFSNLHSDDDPLANYETFHENDLLEIGIDPPSSPNQQESVTLPNATTQIELRKHSKKRKSDMELEREMIKLLKSEDEDEFSVFGRLVATKLRNIHAKNPKSYYETQHFISTMLNEEELKLIQ